MRLSKKALKIIPKEIKMSKFKTGDKVRLKLFITHEGLTKDSCLTVKDVFPESGMMFVEELDYLCHMESFRKYPTAYRSKIIFNETDSDKTRITIFKLEDCLSIFTVEPDKDRPKLVGCVANKELSRKQAIQLRDFLNAHYPEGDKDE